MNKMKAILKWLSLITGSLILILVAGVFLLPSPYAVNISLGDIIGGEAPDTSVVDSRFSVPDGFRINIFAKDLNHPRVIRQLSSGNFVLSQPRKGEVTFLLADSNGDGISDGRHTIFSDLDNPHGLALYKDWLYIAELGAVGRVKFDQTTGKTQGDYQKIITDLPTDGGHWTRTIRFGPDGLLYLSVGSSCNVCIEKDKLRSTISRYQPDGSGREIIATGLRNSVDFDWDKNGQLYATDNGRDFQGDDFPPDELNKIVVGGFYGWPFANGDNVPDPDFGKGHETEIAKAIVPYHKFRAHNAPLGIQFYDGGEAPALKGTAMVALHGSWNRSVKDGYKVVSLHWDKNGKVEERDLVTGFLKNGNVIGRPAFVEQGQKGEIYITDDFSKVVYRLVYHP